MPSSRHYKVERLTSSCKDKSRPRTGGIHIQDKPPLYDYSSKDEFYVGSDNYQAIKDLIE